MSAASIFADDLYARLDVERAAPVEEIKQAYRRLLRQYPPERAPEEFKRIREAYETLTDPDARHEYDNQPDPAIQRLLDQAFTAMGREDYPTAERLFKQVLIQQPELAFARNHLGLCFLYQERAEAAVEQFERLMRTEPHAAYIFGNAGHAYLMAERLPDAERAFRYAIDLGAEDSAGYFVGLANVYVEQRRLGDAKRMLEDAIRADGRVDFEDLQYFTKLLEVHILDRDLEGTESVLERVERIVSDQEQAQYVAWKLGKLGQDLVRLRGFRYAALFAATAERLQKQDGDYSALRRVAEYLEADDIHHALGLARNHPSFQPSGWLSELRAVVEEHCQRRRVFSEMKPLKKAPSLGTINGIGFSLRGKQSDYDAGTGSVVQALYFVFFFIPLLPIARYRVIRRGNQVSFLGKLPLSDGQKLQIGLVVAAAIYLGFLFAYSVDPPRQGQVPSQRPAATSTSNDQWQRPPGENPVRSVPGAASSAPAPPRSSATAERNRIRGYESRLRMMEAEMQGTQAELESLRSQIRRIESNAELGIWYDEYEYDRLINRHNLYVEEYNASLATYNALYSEYTAAVDDYNRRFGGR